MGGPENKIYTIQWADEQKKKKQAQYDEEEYQVRIAYGSNNYPAGAKAQAQLYGVDGNPQEFEMELPINYCKLYAYSCFPCFIPPPCNAANSHRYCLAMASASFIISVIDVIMLIVELALGGFESPKYNWTLGPTSEAMIKLGCKDASRIKNDYELWRLFTPIFLHGGFIHLIMNLGMQLKLGMMIERRWNTLRWLIVYFASGIIANCYSIMCYPKTLGVGASGALLGLFGGFFVDILLNKKQFQLNTWLSLIGQLLISIVIIFIFSFAPGVDFVAHIFGFIAGAIITLGLLCHQCDFINKRILLKIILWIVSIAFSVFSVVLCLLLLYLDVLKV